MQVTWGRGGCISGGVPVFEGGDGLGVVTPRRKWFGDPKKEMVWVGSWVGQDEGGRRVGVGSGATC